MKNRNFYPRRARERTPSPASSFGLHAVIIICVCASLPGCTSMNMGGSTTIDADADALLRKMSDKLSSAKQFTVRGTRSTDPALVEGRNIKQHTKIEGSIIRPDRISAKASSGGLTRRFIYDGNDVTLYDVEMNHYATVKGASTIDRTIDKIIEKWDFHPPMTDLLVSDPYRSLTSGADDGKIIGNQSINGVRCQRIAVTRKVVNWEIWIANNDHLPRKLVITFKDLPDQPRVQLVFREWNLNPKLKNSQFIFDPPKDAIEIEMAPTGR